MVVRWVRSNASFWDDSDINHITPSEVICQSWPDFWIIRETHQIRYRLLRSYFVQTQHWGSRDPFYVQKIKTFQHSATSIFSTNWPHFVLYFLTWYTLQRSPRQCMDSTLTRKSWDLTQKSLKYSSMKWSRCVFGELFRDHIFIDIISYIIPSSGEMRQ